MIKLFIDLAPSTPKLYITEEADVLPPDGSISGTIISEDPLPGTIPKRTSTGDIKVRSVETSYQSQSVMPSTASMAFRVNNSTDSQLRFVDVGGAREWIGRALDSSLLMGKSVEQIKKEARQNLVPDSFTINGIRLNTPITLTAGNIGLGNVANYGNTSGWNGQSTTLYATQKAVYDAATAPNLAGERKRVIMYGTAAPSGTPEEGTIYLQHS